MGLLDQILNGVTSLGMNNSATQTETTPSDGANAGSGGLGGLGGGLGGAIGGMLGGGKLGGGMLGGGMKGQLLTALLSMLASGKLGGLDGLLNKFKNNGMQNQLASWVSANPNENVSPAQVEQALGKDTVSEIAQKAGVNETEAAQGLSELIPQLVDKMTPTGELPQEDVVSDVLGKLGMRF